VELKVGSRWKSACSDVEMIVVRAPGGDVDLQCGGQPVIPLEAERPAGDAAPAEGETLMGKRYGGDELGIELLCTKAGKGALSLAGEPIPLKEAKPLPSSD
jgi:hypothetical protein